MAKQRVESRNRGEYGMRFSFSTAALYPRDSLDSLDLIKEAGYDAAELMPQCMEETLPCFAKKVMSISKMRVASIHFPLVFFSIFYNPYPGMIKEARTLIDNITSLAGALETNVIVIHPPYFTNKTQEKLFYAPVMDNMRYLCMKSKENGVKVSLENNPKGGRTPEEMLKVIHEVNCENIFPMIDTTEAVESGQDPVYMLKKLDVIHIHASDHKGEDKHILPGQGDLDWKKIFSVLEEKKFSGFFTVEPLYKYFLEDPVQKMKAVLKYLTSL